MNDVSFHKTDASCDLCARKKHVARIVFRVLDLFAGREPIVLNLCDSCRKEFITTMPQACANLAI